MSAVRTSEIRAYLEAIADNPAGGLIDIRYAIGRAEMARRFVSADHLDAAVRLIASLAKRTDTYTGVVLRTQRSGTRQAVARSHLLFVEIDAPHARGRLERFAHEPTIVIASGSPGHLHAYWRLRKPVDADELEAANRKLAHHLDGDLASVDAARILRPAGTLNYKHAPSAAVRLVSLTRERLYDLSELVATLPAPASRPAPPTAPRQPDRSGLDGKLLAIPGEQYVRQLAALEATRTGKVRCPFHEDHTPSLHLYPDGTWACFGCRRGGTIYDFASHLWGIETKGRPFIDLRERVADEFGISPPIAR
jgi:RepB DNA-primase from phage plasmid/CHC2 zinc finger